MKKLTLILFAALVVSTAAGAQNRTDRQQLDNPGSFSMILLGDPQTYTKYDINQPIFELCTAWIADNLEQLKIKAVLCTGDLTEQNENLALNRRMLNQTSREMYGWASHCFERLDNKVPYIICPGNHEYGYKHSENGHTHYPEYFPFERNSCWRDILISSFPGRDGAMTMENAAFEFNDGHWGGMLVICSEFAPRDEVLEWALNLCNDKKYKDYKVIFLTHSLLRQKTAAYTDNEKYAISPRNWGQGVWDKLLKPAPNIVLAICGHTGVPGGTGKVEDDYIQSTAYRCDKNAAGRDVHQMMFNVQTLGGGWEGNGGDGWLRILEFCPDGKTIKVKTYSPLFGISPLTKHLAHRTAPYDQFEMVVR